MESVLVCPAKDNRMKRAGKAKTRIHIARDFFVAELGNVLSRNRVPTQHETVEYMADVMVRYLESENFFARSDGGRLKHHVLADLYAEYLAGSSESRKFTLRKLGDLCLLISGFFADSLKRKVVDIDYYLGMGETAYWTLSHMHLPPVKVLYQEMAQKMRPFSSALGELSERTGVQSNSDLLRVYERWLHTGSDRLRNLLHQHGITIPAKPDSNFRH